MFGRSGLCLTWTTSFIHKLVQIYSVKVHVVDAVAITLLSKIKFSPALLICCKKPALYTMYESKQLAS